MTSNLNAQIESINPDPLLAEFMVELEVGGARQSLLVTAAVLLSPGRFATQFLEHTGRVFDTSHFEGRKGKAAWRQLVADALAANGGDA